MRIRLSIPDHLVTPQALEAALEATALANEQAIVRGEVPSLSDAISGGVRWKPEPFMDGEHFDLSHKVVQRGWGDCDDLAPWLAGELRATGDDPGAIPRVYKTGKDRWHVVVQTSDGQILDPSKWAGMGKRSANPRGVGGAVAKPFAHHEAGALCVMPGRGKWWARCDVPWGNGAAGHLASHARARTPEDALDQAIAGAMVCGEHIGSSILDRVRDAGQLLLADAESIIGDESEVGQIFSRMMVSGGRDWKKAPPGAVARYALRWRTDANNRKGQPYTFSALGRQFTLRTRADEAALPDEAVDAFWSSLTPEKRHTFRDHWDESGETFFDKALGVATGPAGFVLNPAMALGAKTLTDKKFAGMRNMAANAAMPGAGGMLASAGDSVLSSLTHGAARGKVPGAVTDAQGGQSVSLPYLPPAEGQPADRPMTLYYHPAGAIGPVVMRF